MNVLIWLGLLLLFIIVEAQSVSIMSVWFAVGSLAALIANLLGAEVWLQITLFFVVSGITLALLRPVVRKFFTPKLTKTNVDAMTEKICTVTVAIDNSVPSGQVKVGDVEWTARSESGDPIPVGTRVQIRRIEGVKAYVAPATVNNKKEEKIWGLISLLH